MQTIHDWEQLNNNLRSFRDNLRKDSTARREDTSVTARKVGDLQKFRAYLQDLDKQWQSDIQDKAVDYKTVILGQDLVKRCKEKVEECQVILDERLGKPAENADTGRLLKNIGINADNVGDNEGTFSDHILQVNYENNFAKMGESFSFKTASALLPKLDGSTDTVHQLIESIDFYESSLAAESKPQVINYVLKICLSHRDRIRMKSGYTTVFELIVDLKRNFLPKQSAPSLIAKMQASSQGNLTTSEYGRSIETLMADLTIAQVGEIAETQVIEVISKQNEKLAVDIFAKGLRSREIRTVIKARNYERLSEAISAANEEALSADSESTVNVIRGKFHSRPQTGTVSTHRRNNGNHWETGNQPRFHNQTGTNTKHLTAQRNFNQGYYNKSFEKNQTFGRHNYNNNSYRGGKFHNRGRFNYTNRNFNNSNRMYTAQNEIPRTETVAPEPFFRDPQV